MSQIVIMTMMFYRSAEELRAKLGLRTAEEAKREGLPLVVVDGGSPTDFQNELGAREALVYKQRTSGMGAARRELYQTAMDAIAGENDAVVWLEAEKWPLVSQCRKIAEPITNGNADFVIPNRNEASWASYPPAQQLSEKLGNLAWYYLTGLAVDIFWGPFAVNRRALKHFLDYDGRYGDRWDAHFIPRLQVLAAGLRAVGVNAEYEHPAEQAAAETGNLEFVIKRIEQLWNQVPTVVKEAERLGFKR